MTEFEKTSETLETPVDVRPNAPSRPGFLADLGRWLLKTPTLALVVFAAPVISSRRRFSSFSRLIIRRRTSRRFGRVSRSYR